MSVLLGELSWFLVSSTLSPRLVTKNACKSHTTRSDMVAAARSCTAIALLLLVVAACPAAAFAPGAALPLRMRSRAAVCAVAMVRSRPAP